MKGTIVFLINSKYPYYSGGRENWLYNVSETLCSYFDIIVVSHKQEKEMSHFENINSSVKFVKVATLKNIPILGKLMRHYLSVIDNLYGAWEMYKVCRV